MNGNLLTFVLYLTDARSVGVGGTGNPTRSHLVLSLVPALLLCTFPEISRLLQLPSELCAAVRSERACVLFVQTPQVPGSPEKARVTQASERGVDAVVVLII